MPPAVRLIPVDALRNTGHSIWATFAAVAATMLSVAALACPGSGLEGSRFDPMQALRTE